MNELTDKELGAAVELAQTQLTVMHSTARALRAEMQLTEIGANEITGKLRALMVEQERRDAEKKAEAQPAEAEK